MKVLEIIEEEDKINLVARGWLKLLGKEKKGDIKEEKG